jgi:hypothetical protein
VAAIVGIGATAAPARAQAPRTTPFPQRQLPNWFWHQTPQSFFPQAPVTRTPYVPAAPSFPQPNYYRAYPNYGYYNNGGFTLAPVYNRYIVTRQGVIVSPVYGYFGR